MTFSKEFIKQCIDWLEDFSGKQRLSRRSVGICMRSLHFNAPLYIILFVTFCPKIIADLTALYFAVILLFFYLFRGCWMTMLETRLCNDDFVIIDPFIEFFGCEINPEMRYNFTMVVMLYFLTWFIWIYYYRFLR